MKKIIMLISAVLLLSVCIVGCRNNGASPTPDQSDSNAGQEIKGDSSIAEPFLFQGYEFDILPTWYSNEDMQTTMGNISMTLFLEKMQDKDADLEYISENLSRVLSGAISKLTFELIKTDNLSLTREDAQEAIEMLMNDSEDGHLLEQKDIKIGGETDAFYFKFEGFDDGNKLTQTIVFFEAEEGIAEIILIEYENHPIPEMQEYFEKMLTQARKQ